MESAPVKDMEFIDRWNTLNKVGAPDGIRASSGGAGDQSQSSPAQILPPSPTPRGTGQGGFATATGSAGQNPRSTHFTYGASSTAIDRRAAQSRKKTLAQRYEAKMHRDPHREVFAITTDNKSSGGSGSIFRSGIIHSLPSRGGKKHIKPNPSDPTAAGGRPKHVLDRGGDASLQWRPHERQVDKSKFVDYAGVTSGKFLYMLLHLLTL